MKHAEVGSNKTMWNSLKREIMFNVPGQIRMNIFQQAVLYIRDHESSLMLNPWTSIHLPYID